MSDESYKTKIQLITPKELCKLREMLIGTEAEELYMKLHTSYNAVKILAQSLKDENKMLKENQIKK